MTTSVSTIEYITEQLAACRNIRTRKMFGDYALYCDEKVVALICDDQMFVKYTQSGKQFAEGRYTEGIAYPGAKPSMQVTDFIEDREFLSQLIQMTANELPLPKPKKKKI